MEDIKIVNINGIVETLKQFKEDNYSQFSKWDKYWNQFFELIEEEIWKEFKNILIDTEDESNNLN